MYKNEIQDKIMIVQMVWPYRKNGGNIAKIVSLKRKRRGNNKKKGETEIRDSAQRPQIPEQYTRTLDRLSLRVAKLGPELYM